MKSSKLSNLSQCWYIIYSPRQAQGITRSLSKHVRSADWTRSIVVWNAFERETKHVRMRSQTRSNEKLNVLEREAKRIRTRSQTHWTRSQMRSNEKLNAFEREAKRVWMRNLLCSLKVWNALERDSKRLLTASKTRSKLSTDNIN